MLFRQKFIDVGRPGYTRCRARFAKRDYLWNERNRARPLLELLARRSRPMLLESNPFYAERNYRYDYFLR